MSKSIATPTAAAASAPRDPAAPNSDQTTTVEKFTEGNIEAILRSEEHRRASAPSSYRKIQTLTAYCGTIPFLIANAALTLLWMAVNQWLWRFDPYPYTFLVFGLSIEAIFLSILILISQNMATAESERRHHLDLQINLLNERETTALLRLTTLMASALGVSHAEQQDVRQFADETDPAAVFSQIVQAEERRKESAEPITPMGAKV